MQAANAVAAADVVSPADVATEAKALAIAGVASPARRPRRGEHYGRSGKRPRDGLDGTNAVIVAIAGVDLGRHGAAFIAPVSRFYKRRAPAPADGAETIRTARSEPNARFG